MTSSDDKTRLDPSSVKQTAGVSSSGDGASRTPHHPFAQDLRTRYHLIRTLGKGGFATVYLAHDTVLDQDVAIKALKLEQTSQTDRDRFLREARISAKLRHPNIATVFDIVQTDEGLQMIMEYYPEGALSERIKADGPLSPMRTIEVFRDVARALSHAHRRDVVHRDIKPANIFLGEEGTVKLGDFGIAAHTELHEYTQTGMIVGTPLYMAPEQANDSRDVDPRADIYALGLTLYHALTGRSPRVLNLDRVVPEPFRDLIRHATEHEREDRPVSADQFIAALDRIETQLRRASQTTQTAEALTTPSDPASPPIETADNVSSAADSNAETRAVTELAEASVASAAQPKPRARWGVAAALMLTACVALVWGGARSWRMLRPVAPPAPAAPRVIPDVTPSVTPEPPVASPTPAPEATPERMPEATVVAKPSPPPPTAAPPTPSPTPEPPPTLKSLIHQSRRQSPRVARVLNMMANMRRADATGPERNLLLNKAIASMELEVREHPKNIAAQALLGRLYAARGRSELAARHLERARKLIWDRGLSFEMTPKAIDEAVR